MRLHRLDLTAFGPYPRHESVDFDALGVDGLFLLHGDTGAGKTTVLDAVAFALFGVVPGARGDVKRLRCDYADPGTATEVALEFTVQGHRLRLVRSPEYERPKRSGTGVTTQRARASLTWVGPAPGGPTPDGLTRIDDVAQTVQRLLGMSAAQFFQVVLLPQGEFARFLRADTSDREVLLERLFGTERFADVEKWFRTARTARFQAVEERRREARVLVARVAQAAGDEPPDEDDANAAWLATQRDRLASAAESAAKEEILAAEARGRADASLREQRELAGRVRRVRAATDTLVSLAAAAPAYDASTAELAAARRTVRVQAAARAVDAATAEVATAARDEDIALRASRTVAALDDGWSPSAVGAVAALRRRADGRRDEAGALQPLLAEAEVHRTDEARVAALGERERTARSIGAELAGRLAALPERLAAERAGLAGALRAAERVDALAAREAECRALHRDGSLLPEAERAAGLARAAAADRVDRHQRARDVLLDVRQRRLDGMAAELAGGLVAGAPCVVCGSPEHPAPAAAGAEPVGEEGERAAAEAEQRAARERESAADTARLADLRLAGLRERVGDHSPAALADALSAVSAELLAATERAETVAALTESVAALEADAESLRGRLAEAERLVAGAGADRAALEAAVAERGARLRAARGEHPDVPNRRAHLLAVADALDALADAVSTRLAAEGRRRELVAALGEAAGAAGFAGPADALAAARDEDTITALADGLAEVDNRTAAARAVLAEPELAGIRADTPFDVRDALRMAEEAEREAVDATEASRAAARRLREVAGLAARLTRAWAELAPVAAEYGRLAALADVVNGKGQNERRMSLRSYVLAARLAEVAVAATRRLRQVSQGRYSFVRSDAAGPNGTRGGLGLDVLDDYSGQVRPAKTLSGGESFLASLSLALGLADVVAAETGGALLNTLFVDEGFGTLDADTLDEVMNTLDELRAGGRVVGLVSHVEELRHRIPVRLRVRKARTGSTLELSSG